MKKIIKGILKFTFDTAGFVCFLLELMYWRRFCNPIKTKCSGALVVLTNGPSLKEIIPLLTASDEFKNVDYIVVNLFAFENVFFQIKPKYYCLADPMFINDKDAHRKDSILKFFNILQNEVDWDMSIYVPNKLFRDKFLSYSQITNKYVHCIPLNSIEYRGYDSFRYFFYKKGLSMPVIQNVSIMAIYAGLNMNYSDIRLYGADHTFFDSICVNDQNQLCNRNKHFYEKEVELKPIIDNGILWKVSDYFLAMSIVFRGHDILNGYAKYLNAKIVNYTKVSMIDSYERKNY